MNVLVAYASKHGSTAEIAQAIAESLREADLDAECVEACDVDSLEAYDAVVLGSAVYMGRWRGDAKRFLRKHRQALHELPLWVFSSGPTGPPSGDDPRWTEPRRTMERVERLGAREHVVFGGRLPTTPRGPAHRGMVNGCPPEYRDRRDWDEIRSWARGIASALGTLATTR